MAPRKVKYLLGEVNRQIGEMLPEDERAAMEQKNRKKEKENYDDSPTIQLQQKEREERQIEGLRIRESRNALELALEKYQRVRRNQRVRTR